MSLDALRGFDMFWIVGGEGLIRSVATVNHSALMAFLVAQLTHRDWEGVTFYDLIFPLFVFMVGVSLVFSLDRILAEKGRAAALKRILRRSLLLFVIGVIYSSGPLSGIGDIRLLGVLQRIALCYLFTGILYCALRPRGLVITCGVLLVGYWALMTFVPVPGEGAGNFQEGHNLANYFDRRFLPFRKYDGDHDPEGILSTLPATASCLLGIFAGRLLKNAAVPSRKKVKWLLILGVAGVVLGFLWGIQFPVVKKIWTSSYVLVAAGYSSILLAAFHQVIEVWGFRTCVRPFVWIGRNPITMYLLFPVLAFLFMIDGNLGPGSTPTLGIYAELARSLATLALVLAVAYALDRRKIYLRL
jgi:predicted acyltransferase